jgi:hypothetical protein
MAERFDQFDGHIYEWMQTNSGKKFYIEDPRPEDIDIRDIAHGLGLLCRYNGQCDRFYSVAEHCIHLVNQVRLYKKENDPCRDFFFLMHDSSEAYISDIVRGFKKSIKVLCRNRLISFEELENKILRVIFQSFNLNYDEFICYENDLKEFDTRILINEKKDNFKNSEMWDVEKRFTPLVSDKLLNNMTPTVAESLFLGIFGSIYSQVMVKKGLVKWPI